MTVELEVLIVGLVLWLALAVGLGIMRKFHAANIARIALGGLIFLVVVALGAAPPEAFEVKVLAGALGGGLFVQGFERERRSNPRAVEESELRRSG